MLDAGCGDGRLVYEARKAGIDMTGIDASEKALRFARAYMPDVDLAEGDISAMPFPDASFNCVVCSEVLEHIEPEKTAKTLSEIKRVLKPGGAVIVTVPSARTRVSGKHHRHFRPEDIEEALSGVFEDVRVEGLYKRSFLWVWELPFYVFSAAMLLLYPLRLKWLCGRVVGWIAELHWAYYGRFLAKAATDSARGLLAVGIRPASKK